MRSPSQVAVLSRLQHPHIVCFLGACLLAPNACIIEELVEGGSLHNFLHGYAFLFRMCLPMSLAPAHAL